VPGRADDGEVALPVGAVDPHAVAREQPQRGGGGVTVVVVGADRDEGDARPAGREERRIDVCAAVVGHLQHVGAQVDPPCQDPRLGLGTEVTGEQDPHPVHGHPCDDGEVVGLRTRGGDRRRRRQHLQGGVPDGPPISGHEGHPASSDARGQPVHRADPVVRR
jgi:hypothetical protein